MDYVIPKTYFNDTDRSYYASITVCVKLDHRADPGTLYIHVNVSDVHVRCGFESHLRCSSFLWKISLCCVALSFFLSVLIEYSCI